MRTFITSITSMLVVVCLGLSACSTTPKSQYQIDEQRASVRDMTSQTLAQLYQANPASRNAIRNAAGYAAFSNFGMKILFFGGAKGEGLAVNNATGQEIFMKMVELQPGLGLGAEKFRLVFVFDGYPFKAGQFCNSVGCVPRTINTRVCGAWNAPYAVPV